MKKKKKEITTVLAHYLGEVKKYSILSKEEEEVLAKKIEKELESLKIQLLDIPFSWVLLIRHYKNLKQEKKAVSKMSNLYGVPSESSKELTRGVEECINSLIDITQSHYYSKITEEKRKEVSQLVLQANLSNSLYFDMIPEMVDTLPFFTKGRTGFIRKELKERVTKIKETEAQFISLRNDFLTSNLRLVISFAIQYQHLGVPIEDLIQEGNMALIRAIEKFDTSRNIKFSTYATWWVKQSFIKLFRNQGRIVRLPSHIHELAMKINKVAEDIEREQNRFPSNKELAGILKINPAIVEKISEMYIDPISLETEVSRAHSGSQVKSLKDFLIADVEDPIVSIFDKQTSKRIEEAINKLPTLYKEVIRLRYGIGTARPKTLDEIARLIEEPSRERIRKIEYRALKELKVLLGGTS